jgi:thioredoxin reductase (NADPH)
MSDVLDCLIVGGGPAGLTAAIYLGRFRRRVLLIDKGWSRAEWIPRSHNLPGFPEGVEGPALLDNMRAQARLYGAVMEKGVIEALHRRDDGLFRADMDALSVAASTVILATGVTENKPPVAHVADAVKAGLIRTCPICDGYETIGKHIAVLGAGEHAANEALFLRTYTNRLSLLLTPADIANLSQDIRSALAEAGIKLSPIVIGSVTLDEDGVTATSADDGRRLQFDAIYTAYGTTPQTQLARNVGARMDEAGRLFVSEHQETSIEGLFAAGDLVRGLNQISVANGEAAVAATAIHNRLPKVFA